MKFITIRIESGQIIQINTEHIVCIDDSSGIAIIYLSNGREYKVNFTILKILDAINDSLILI